VIINHKQAAEIACLVSKEIVPRRLKRVEKIRIEANEKRPMEKSVSLFLNSKRRSFFARRNISLNRDIIHPPELILLI
jgi:hypothetical protein